MGFRITVGVVGGKAIEKDLKIVISRTQDMRGAWKDIRNTMIRLQKSAFLGKGKPKGISYYGTNVGAGMREWKELADSTVKEKERVAPQWTRHPLIRTEKLMNAWTKKKHGGGAIRIEHKHAFVFGIEDEEIPYAGYHQDASPGGGGLPRRRHYRTLKGVQKMIVKAIQLHISRAGKIKREEGFYRKNPIFHP